MPSKPASKSFHVLASELNYSGGAPTIQPLVWASNGGAQVVQTDDANGLGSTFTCADQARSTQLNITVTGTAPNGKVGTIVLQWTPDPSVIASIGLSVDPLVDP